MENSFSQLLISPATTLKEALTHMDKVGFKLLMIVDLQNKLLGLLTIGDIQRAIIANHSLEETVIQFGRNDIITAKYSDPVEKIKQQMLHYRLVYMPVLSEINTVIKVFFWEDLIKEEEPLKSRFLNLPVVIMAGGFGSRLRPLTNVLPKPLLPIGEKTMLEDIIRRFQTYGCNDFSISVNYKERLIRFYFEEIPDKNYNIFFFTEEKPLGTAGSLHLLKEKLNQTFFVTNCDILIDEDYAAIYDYHVKHQNELTIVAAVKNYHIPYGTIESREDGQLVALREKPQMSYLINCGMYILEPHLLSQIPESQFYHITSLIEAIKSRDGRVGVFPISGKSWTDMGEWNQYIDILEQSQEN